MGFKKVNLFSQTQKPDLSLLLVTALLVIFGLLIVYDSSAISAFRDFDDSYYYIKQQIIWTVLGTISLLFFSKFNYNKFRFLAVPMLLGSLGLLLAVFIPGLGVAGGGAHRWLRLGGITIQPAEIIKLTSVIYLSVLFEKRVKLIPFLVLVAGVSGVTAVLQKDLGTTIVFATTSAFIYFAAGGTLWHFVAAVPAIVAALAFLIFTSSYRSKRIMAFLDPFADPQGYTYHIFQVLLALGSGGLFGLGLGQSRQKFQYIPEVSTDSIFGIVGEELGFLGGSLLIGLFIFLILRGLRIAKNCPDNFGKILAVGITSWLGIQIIVNLSAMTSLLPLTGVPLPFISYGGSALVANLAAVGILLNISKSSQA